MEDIQTSIIKKALKETGKVPANFIQKGDPFVIDIEHGLLLPKIKGWTDNHTRHVLKQVFPDLHSFGNTFHKSWKVIEETPQEELWAQAVIHYFTTYGLEALGLADEKFIYIPDEIDCTPELRKFRVIGFIDPDEMVTKMINKFYSGIALNQDTIDNYLSIIEYYGGEIDINQIRNRELRLIMFRKLGEVPEDPNEIVHLIYYLLTGKTSLIQNKDTISLLHHTLPHKLDALNGIGNLLEDNEEELAKVFFRYKQVFLALRHMDESWKISVNRIRRLAKHLKQPYHPEPYISTQILQGKQVSRRVLEKMNTFDLVKISNKLSYVAEAWRVDGHYNDVTVLRHGRMYVNKEPKTMHASILDNTLEHIDIIYDIIKQRLNPDDKRQVILPEGLDLAIPTSEKSFIGNVPLYSQYTCNNASIVGISWDKYDLDLSAILSTGVKIGWNGSYKAEQEEIYYSGDQTRGGAEAILFKNTKHREHTQAILYVNRYYGAVEELNMFLSSDEEFSKPKSLEDKPLFSGPESRIYNPNNIVYSTKLAMDGNCKILGHIDIDHGETVLTFVDMIFGSSNVAGATLPGVLVENVGLRGRSADKISDYFDIITPEEYDEQIEKATPEEAEKIKTYTVDLRDFNKLEILSLVDPEQ